MFQLKTNCVSDLCQMLQDGREAPKLSVYYQGTTVPIFKDFQILC